jgi:membrane protease YdiL (CAAX protease family)
MQTAAPGVQAPAAASPLKLALVFAVLFIAYQLPQGLGMRVMHSVPVMSALMLMFLPIAWLAGRALGYRGLDAWFMGLTPRWSLLLAACFALAVLAKTAALGAGAMIGVYQLAAPSHAGVSALVLGGLWTLLQTFFPSVAEDILTRGFLMRAMPALSTRWMFVVASASLYVLNHIYRLANGPSEWLALFCYGLAYAAALFYSRSLWAAIGLHWGWNFAGDYVDQVVPIDLVAPTLQPLLSAATHVVVLLVVVAAGVRAASRRQVPQVVAG